MILNFLDQKIEIEIGEKKIEIEIEIVYKIENPDGHASMLLLGEGSEATEPYNKYDKIPPHSIRSLQFVEKVRPLSFRPEKLDLFTATHCASVRAWRLISCGGVNDFAVGESCADILGEFIDPLGIDSRRCW